MSKRQRLDAWLDALDARGKVAIDSDVQPAALELPSASFVDPVGILGIADAICAQLDDNTKHALRLASVACGAGIDATVRWC